MTHIPFETIAKKLREKRVMLVGGAGFIGHNFALELKRAGAEVMVVDNLMVNNVIDRLYDSQSSVIRRDVYTAFLLDRVMLLRQAGVILRNADARQSIDLSLAFQEFQPTSVVHLSAIASAVEARKNPGLCFDLQLVTLRNVLEQCRLQHKQVGQVMLLSSSTVYGDFETPTVDERTRPKPRGIYANTKYMAERLVRTYNDQHGLGTIIIRPSALYGERCVSQRVSQVFIENAVTGRPLPLEGGGDGRLDFTYINDLVDGMARALALHDGRVSDTFNITFGGARTIAELAAIVKELVPNAVVEDRPRAADKPVRGTLSIERAQSKLGFAPSWPLDQGYRKYCQWYIEQWEKAKRGVNQ